jgi:ribosomal protein S27AE
MAQPDPMICPHCGVAMNRHAEKVDYTAALSEDDAVDPDFGGVLEEAHTCPRCGKSATRRAARPDADGA